MLRKVKEERKWRRRSQAKSLKKLEEERRKEKVKRRVDRQTSILKRLDRTHKNKTGTNDLILEWCSETVV